MFMSKAEVTAVDILAPDRIAGWYHCFKSSSNQIVVMIEGRAPRHVVCDGSRPDVLESPFGLSSCGFDVRIEPPIAPDVRIEIASQETGTVLFSGTLAHGLMSSSNSDDDASSWSTTESSQNNDARTDMPTLVFDLTNLIGYVGEQDNLTGIQRVQSCIVLSIFKDKIYPENNMVITTYDRARGKFLAIKSSYIIQLLEDLMRPPASRIVSFDKVRAKDGALPNTTYLDLESVRDNVIFCQMGAVVGDYDYFYKVNEIKRDFGAHFALALYDMIPIYCSHTCDSNIVSLFKRGIDQALRCADVFLVTSENSGRDLGRYCAEQGVQSPAMVVTQAGSSFDEFITGDLADSQATQAIDMPERYVLFVSTIEGRKNHRFIFDIWAQLEREIENAPSLVCVGKIGWRAEEFLQRLVETDYLGGKIIIHEGVSDTQLDKLYRNCLFSVFPSLYEGWGLPVGEALSKGKLCVASTKGSIPEVGRDLTIYVDIDDMQSAYATIKRLITDEPYRLHLERTVVQNFQPIAWRTVAERIVQGCLLARASDPKGLWPTLEIGREYSFRDTPRVPRDRAGLPMLNSIKEARRGLLSHAFLDDESFCGALESRHGKGWSYLEDWGTWSLYRPAPELWFSLPEGAGPEVDWYMSLTTIAPLEGRYCKVMIGNQVVANIRLPGAGGLLRVARLQVGITPESRRFAVRFVIEQDDALERTLKETDVRAPGIGFRSMMFLDAQNFAARLELLENQMGRVSL